MTRTGISVLLVVAVSLPARAQRDPADSLYRVARNALNVGDYGRAARLFSSLTTTYPKSAVTKDAAYYEATARYRIGTTDELRTAAKVLETIGDYNRTGSDADAATLYTRINGVLARRGDRDAADKVAKSALAGGRACDPEDIQVSIAALNALTQLDAAKSAPILRTALERRDDCATSVRKSAVFMLGRRTDAESLALLIGVAKSDPDHSVRADAIRALGSERASAQDAAFLRGLYVTVEDDNLKRAIIDAVARIRGAENEQWILGVAKNPTESSQLRSEAIARVMRLNLAIAEVAKLYDAADSYNVRTQIINLLKARRENEAAEKLYDIVKTGTDMKLKLQALNALISRGDPRSQQLVLEIIKQ
jgi:HEAT repeat protein